MRRMGRSPCSPPRTTCSERKIFLKNLRSPLLQKSGFVYNSLCVRFAETWPSGRRRALGERLSSNAPRVRISTSPPVNIQLTFYNPQNAEPRLMVGFFCCVFIRRAYAGGRPVCRIRRRTRRTGAVFIFEQRGEQDWRITICRTTTGRTFRTCWKIGIFLGKVLLNQ